MEINGEDYNITYNPTTATIVFHGSLRLLGMNEYAPIVQLLDEVVTQALPIITLNVRNLNFLNSSGINMLSRFVINIRKQSVSQLIIQGSLQVPWQAKSLVNLQRLMPAETSLELV